ncbi:MAG: hypothetical protein P4N59_29505 [Negativicutes bacterium]|nr:hypothetical protein [Negativicutes bacterium]
MKITNVSIATAEVEIKVIRVGKSKMTLAVYEQIPKADYDGKSPMLGWVRRCPSYCDPGRHYHFIWVEDGELRRDHVYDPFEIYHGRVELSDEWINTYRTVMEAGQIFIAI